MSTPYRKSKPNYVVSVVDRPRLYRVLDRWEAVRAVVVQAPAGYGKSSLVSRWLDISNNAARAAWLSLEETDCDPRELVRSLSGALDTVLPGLLAAMRPILKNPRSEPQRAITKMVRTLWDNPMADHNARHSSRLLVVDDLHLIANSEAASLLMPLVEQGPPGLHLMLLTRDLPPLPLTRLLAGGQMAALTAADLRFTAAEVRQYLDLHQLSPTADELAQIERLTEGWVIALALALHSVPGQGSIGEYLRTLRGDNRWIARYLVQEALDQQSPAMRDFLLRTSILPSFSAPLAATVAGIDDAYALISELRESEFFLIPLDAGASWFRYHHLFRELVEHRLSKVEGQAAIADLHRRAATWLAENGQLLPAIQHLLYAGDEAGSVALVESRIRPIILENPVFAVRLFDALPSDVASRRPRLMLERCLASLMMLYKDLSFHLRNAERSVAENRSSQAEADVLAAELLLYRACLAYAQGEQETALLLARQGQDEIDKLDRLLAGTLEFLLVHLDASTADGAAQAHHARRALASFKAVGFVSGEIAVRRELAGIDLRAGRSAEAGRELDRIASGFGLGSGAARGEMDWVYVYSAEHNYWQNRLGRALDDIKAATEIASIFGDDEMTCHLADLHRLYALKSQRDEETKPETPSGQAFWALHQFADWKIRSLLASDRVEDAWEVAEAYQAGLADDLVNLSYKRALPYLRAYIARGIDLEEARPLLSHALAGSVTGRDYPARLEFLALRAWLELQTGDDALDETLSLAGELVTKTGYVRVLLDIPALTARLAATDRSDRRAVAELAAKEGSPLTGQEQAVLVLLARDLSYAQIAQELVMSVNTVRTHVRHIYKKLDAHRREQATRRAQDLSLLP